MNFIVTCFRLLVGWLVGWLVGSWIKAPMAQARLRQCIEARRYRINRCVSYLEFLIWFVCSCKQRAPTFRQVATPFFHLIERKQQNPTKSTT